ncbi:MAG: porin, partial [Gammaproteobacteria bacterium]|nr:porin [Gammaproteobacteria bacterium]
IGWAGDVGPVGLDLGVTEYTAPGNSSFDGTEFFIGASKDLGPVSLALYYYDADDYDGQQTWELSGEVPVGDFTLSAAWGTQDYDETSLTDYDYWGVGASTELGGFGFALNYSDTDLTNPGDVADDNWWFTISKDL